MGSAFENLGPPPSVFKRGESTFIFIHCNLNTSKLDLRDLLRRCYCSYAPFDTEPQSLTSVFSTSKKNAKLCREASKGSRQVPSLHILPTTCYSHSHPPVLCFLPVSFFLPLPLVTTDLPLGCGTVGIMESPQKGFELSPMFS